MLDKTKQYAVNHTTYWGNSEKVVSFGKLFYDTTFESFMVSAYMKSPHPEKIDTSISTVWAGNEGFLIKQVEVLHEWTSADDDRFAESRNELLKRLNFAKEQAFQPCLF